MPAACTKGLSRGSWITRGTSATSWRVSTARPRRGQEGRGAHHGRRGGGRDHHQHAAPKAAAQ
eukprot:2377564-Pyramimonas_sp.AAC.1